MGNDAAPRSESLRTSTLVPAALGEALATRSAALDLQPVWPTESLALLAQTGVMGWSIPRAFGGSEQSPTAILDGLVTLGEACLTTTFILTQFQAAVHRMVGFGRPEWQHDWLPALARGDRFVTVGLSHLTTSRRRGAGPAVLATPLNTSAQNGCSGYRLSGTIPWVTGGAAADGLVIGAELESGDQLLVFVDRSKKGIVVPPALSLLALTASSTGPVELSEVEIGPEDVLAGPAPQVMKVGATGGTGSLSTSALALASGRRAVTLLESLAKTAPELSEVAAQWRREERELTAALRAASGQQPGALSPEAMRFAANSLATRAAQCALSAAKGTGFVRGHAAERLIRDVMFFYVWSCPATVVHHHWQSLLQPTSTACD